MERLTVEELIALANKRIEEGEMVTLYCDIYKSLHLDVFEGNQWTGGEWKRKAKTEENSFTGQIKMRKNKCNRKYVLQEDGNIGLTPCSGKCIAEIRQGEFVDYTKICDLKG